MRSYRIGRLAGRYVVTWRESGGKRRRYRLDALTPQDAEREAIDRIRRETAPPAGRTVAEIWTEFLADKADRPMAAPMTSAGKQVLAHFGALRPDQITVEHCRDYAAIKRRAGLADGTIWTHLGYLRTALKWAERIRLIAAAPHIERPSQPAPKERYLTRAEIDRLLAVEMAPHIRIAILLLLTTAGRVTAILELTWDRVDMERKEVDLRLPDSTQRKGRARVPINATLRATLTAAREAALSDHVVEWSGEPVRSIKRGFANAVKRAGLRDVSPHTLRHTAAVHMAEAGVPMSEISQYLGHSSTRTTERVYARFSPGHLRKASQALEFGRVSAVRANQRE